MDEDGASPGGGEAAAARGHLRRTRGPQRQHDARRVDGGEPRAPHHGKAEEEVQVQVEHTRLTPRVETARFQLLESASLSSPWFQMSTCTPYTTEEVLVLADGIAGCKRISTIRQGGGMGAMGAPCLLRQRVILVNIYNARVTHTKNETAARNRLRVLLFG